jgi:hypothetical protein
VYERILRVPYYALFNREGNVLRLFRLEGASYRELSDERLWIEELQIGLGLWQGSFADVERQWLRWYDASGQWLPTDQELASQQAEVRAKAAEARAEAAEARSAALAERLRQLGVDPENV